MSQDDLERMTRDVLPRKDVSYGMFEFPESLDSDGKRIVRGSQTYKFTGLCGTTPFANWESNFGDLALTF